MAKLYFYYSSMNAGKSTTLLQADFNYRERGMETMLWTAALDGRYGQGYVTSRIGLKADAHKFSRDTDLLAAISEENSCKSLACVLVDEAQFLSREQVLQLGRVVDESKSLSFVMVCVLTFRRSCSLARRLCSVLPII